MIKKNKIMFSYVFMSTFVEKELKTLKSKYIVEPFRYRTLKDVLVSLKPIVNSNAIFCYFGSIRFLPLLIIGKILRKKIMVASMGYDVAWVPEIKYGNMCKKYKFGISAILGRIVFKMADKVICVSESNFHETIVNARTSKEKTIIIKQGFYDMPEYMRKKLNKNCKINMAITVGRIDSCTIHRKGLLKVAKLSKCLPNIPFVFIGEYEKDALEILKTEAGKNVKFTGWLEGSKLFDFFLRAKVYLQLSLHEAFGCSVAESMLFNCVPIVSDRYALPEVVGNAGFCVDPKNIDEAFQVLDKVFKGELLPKENPRDRVLKEFSMEKRAKKLFLVVDEVLRL